MSVYVGQYVRFIGGERKCPYCLVLAQRQYTTEYNHWDIEVSEPCEGFFVGQRMLGIPEYHLD